LYGSGVEAYPQVPVLSGDMTVDNLLRFLALLLIIGLGSWTLRPLYRYLKRQLVNRTNLGWAPLVLTALILFVVAYIILPWLHTLLVSGFNAIFPVAPELASTENIALGSEIAIPVSRIQFLVIVCSVVLMLGLYYFIHYTTIGKAMRAVAENKEVAALMGINVDRVITITFALGATLAGAAGVLFGLMVRQVNFFMGFVPGLKAFTAAVLGGIGNIPGAMIGGLFLGIFESLGPSLFLESLGIPASYQLKDAIAFTMLVLVLIFRPTGIMGVELGKKKA
jgi:branched-chain amino acid transport system permease protein